jgi:hypothetical protein
LTRWQWLIVLAHVALALIYGAIVPPWEAHDETGHFAYVNHLIAQRNLPNALAEDEAYFDQSHQPPLYYLGVAALTAWIDRSDNVQPEFNFFGIDGTNRRGWRIMLRQPGEAFPWTGTILALHAARAVSALLSGLMIYLIARTANLAFGNASPAALLSTAIAAFNPQVLFMGAMVNNDVMVSVVGALVAYQVLVVGCWLTVNQQPITNTRFVFVGLTLGLGVWSKNSALALIGFVAVALVFLAFRQRWPIRDLIVSGAIVSIAFAIVAAPYFLLNYARYGRLLIDRNLSNPIIAAPTAVIGEGLDVALRDGWLPQIFVNAFQTFWGKFGWGNVPMAEWAYWLFFALTVIGVIGCVIGFRRASRSLRDALVVFALLGVAMMILPLYRAIYFQSPALLPGRYLMPALAAYACLLGFGWQEVIGNWSLVIGRTRVANYQLPITLGLGLFALVVPFAFIAPRYAPPLVAANDRPALLTFNELVQVTDVSARTAYLPDREGNRHYARVKLTWRALNPTDRQYAFGVSVLGRDSEVLGTMNVFPARGNYPSTNWKPGDTFQDEYDILLEKPCAHLPALGRVNVTMFEFGPVSNTLGISVTHQLQPVDGEGRVVAPIVGKFKIDQRSPFPVFWQPPLGVMGGIGLREIALPDRIKPDSTITAALTYEMLKQTGAEGTAFLHVLDENGKLVAQDDHTPQRGEYPTDLWTPGECVRETFTLNIPPDASGKLRAVTGFYSPKDGARFETNTQDDLLPVGEITVEK